MYYYDEVGIEWDGLCAIDEYWNERSMIEISSEAEAYIRKATLELHMMMLEAVDVVVNNNNLLELFGIHPDMYRGIKDSWMRAGKNDKYRKDFQGRFDFAWLGNGTIKLLEYNADTPSLQVETGPLTTEWFQDKFGNQSATYRTTSVDFTDAVFLALEDLGSGLCIMQLGEDEENTALMRWYKGLTA